MKLWQWWLIFIGLFFMFLMICLPLQFECLKEAGFAVCLLKL